MKVYNEAARYANANVVEQINNKPKYKNKDWSDPKNKKLYEQFTKDHQDGFNAEFTKALKRANRSVDSRIVLSPQFGSTFGEMPKINARLVPNLAEVDNKYQSERRVYEAKKELKRYHK